MLGLQEKSELFSVVYDPGEARHQPRFYVRNGELAQGFDRIDRAATLLAAFERARIPLLAPEPFDPGRILAVHSDRYVEFLRRASAHLADSANKDAELVATITRNAYARKYPKTLSGQLEWHMYDLFSPIGRNTYDAAIGAANAALTGARLLLDGTSSAYALCRPPGHHAHKDYGGGYCYFNNAAIAAQYLTDGEKRVAILDIDADHGNGTQEIFYDRTDVLHVSLHADPAVSYPYFTGYEDERGSGAGYGTNLNIPLDRGIGDGAYLAALGRAFDAIARFAPDFCIVALGVDGHADEPNPLFALTTDCYHRIGEALAGLGLPTLLVQEGGYNLKTLAGNVMAVVTPFHRSKQEAPPAGETIESHRQASHENI